VTPKAIAAVEDIVKENRRVTVNEMAARRTCIERSGDCIEK